ncbi:SAM-dependent methyltransferase [Gandjariella thermophila]|uniref:S-adenosyl methyltransferase n=1 Tax=Gandjariella thermophila TaxID=1931992 RepID=A0A4D4J3Z7_9PSEU|nr:SAM-dependent methyltransferase [Gandjariella thermophila]GDY29820.1 hypothetical protein GTS_14530 [Gandjariella thermophila]
MVYVDNEPVAVSHARHMLRGNPHATMIEGDLRDVDGVVRHPETRRLLDFGRPMAVLMVAVQHFLPDGDRPAEVVARYRDAVVPGSYLALSHIASDGSEDVRRAAAWFARTPAPMTPRTHGEFAAMLAGLDLVPPGVTWTTQWHPDGSDAELPSPRHAGIHVGVGRVPGAAAS